MAQPDLTELLGRLERAIGRWDPPAAARELHRLVPFRTAGAAPEPAAEYSQWTLRRTGQREYEIRTIAGDVGRGDTVVDAVQDLLAYLP